MPVDPVGDMIEQTYSELHRLAAGYIRREAHQSVQATELINEAYLRLIKDAPQRFENRPHFVAIAAIAMRRLLVERARARTAAKRGGADHIQVTLNDALLADSGVDRVDMLALDAALDALARNDAQHARVVELRYFGGLSIEETAETLGTSPATVKRQWTFARAWLLQALTGSGSA